ncbi:MAG: type II secretion system protein GspF, partial [Phycisphaerae bacterium]|nr:type II secretion system protein GspF [Phycisphaerae bacterium]
MPTFDYEAISTNGRARRGSISASSRADATRQLLQRGETATSLITAGGGTAIHDPRSNTTSPAKRHPGRPTMRTTEVAALMRELATALEAGLPLMQALRTIR